ncbi:hypothetical protein B0H10DRAFT_2202074 [Mycena sp. CBHHK59/15]|nr:hypothetical protein B0H10DRAFT_2202074 [Mycena sp. CBHHK59/15]
MVVTRASSSPRTSPRSRSSRSSGASSCSSSSSAPPAALSSASARRRRLEAKHTQLYPTTARLGIRGTKAVKRRIVQRRILEKLELFSPYPPEDLALPYNHQGHRLTAMRLRSGYTQNDRWFAGSYHQVCTGCPRCVTKKRVFVRVDPLPHHILEQPELKALFDARTELYPTTGGTTTASIPTAPSPSPSPSPAPAPSPPASPSPVPAPLPADPAAKEAELPIPPHTPMRQTLHFHYGGYGGVDAHYSPAGEILVPDSDSNDPIGDLQYPPTEPIEIALDVCTPVLLIAWYLNADTSCTNTICTMVYPRAKEDENPFTACIIANLVLQDFLDSLEARGLPHGSQIQRFLDATSHWVPACWDDEIPIFGRNRVIYIRTVGLDVTPPDHFVELFPSISAELFAQ